ncbi:MAG: hypothetical protein P8J86_06425 [Phycisphaerales bacterium]|nr:hypothetical protein [Phycisphaerales bacterium]
MASLPSGRRNDATSFTYYEDGSLPQPEISGAAYPDESSPKSTSNWFSLGRVLFTVLQLAALGANNGVIPSKKMEKATD